MNPPTKKQLRVYNYIRWYVRKHQHPPTIREMMAHFGLSPNGIVMHLKALQRKGLIERERYAARGIRVLAEQPKGMPLVDLESLSK